MRDFPSQIWQIQFMREPIRLIFFHGLNTFGDADVHVGPLRLGPMAKHWQMQMNARFPEIQLTVVTAMGSDSLQSQAEHALAEINLLFPPQDPMAPLHLVGQSTGGLVARIVANHELMRERVKTVITVGTPHHGSAAAEFALNTFSSEADFSRFLKPAANVFGYNLETKTRVFRELTRTALTGFNKKYPASRGPSCFSIPCMIDRAQLAWPLHFLYSAIHQITPAPSDGFISLASQILSRDVNESLGFPVENFALDHYSELGYFLAPRPRDRARAVKEFDKMIALVAQIVSSRNDSTGHR